MELKFNFDDLTLGQAEFWCNIAHRTIGDLQAIVEDDSLWTPADLVAMACISLNPKNPEAALPTVRATRIIDITRADDAE